MQRTRNAFTLIELLVVIAIIAILAAILFPVFAQAKAAAKSAVTISNLKQVDLAGLIYANDYDDTVHLYRQSSTVGYYPFLQPYIKAPGVMFDQLRGIGVVIDPALAWTNFVTIAENRNGWVGYEGFVPPSTFIPRQQRVISSQENVAQRAAYMISARQTNLNQGWQFVTDEAGCAVVVNPLTVANDRFNRVYLAAQAHNGFILTGFGDGHAGKVAFSKVGLLNQNPNDAADCAGYGPTNSTYQDKGIDLNFWGTWDDATH